MAPAQAKLSSHKARWLASTLILIISITCIVSRSYIQQLWSRPLLFKFRSWVGKSPGLNPRIKIYAYGDSSLSFTGKEELDLSQWAAILELLDREHPGTIIIDRMFSTFHGDEPSASFRKRVAKLNANLVVGAFVAPHQVPYRFHLPAEKFKYLETGDAKFPTGFFYGPHKSLIGAFKSVGHFDFQNTPFVTPLFQAGTRQFMPHASLLAASSLDIHGGKIWGDQRAIPTNADGNILVNFVDPTKIGSELYAFTNLLKILKEPKRRAEVPRDGVVILLSAMFTGNTQMVDSPFGLIPSGYVTISMVNSVVQGDWLHQPAWGMGLLVMALIIGGVTGLRTGGRTFLLIAVGSGFSIAVVGLFSFSHFSTELPWMESLMVLCASSGLLYLCRVYELEKHTAHLRSAFEGSLPPALLRSILERPSSRWLSPKHRVVSVMFIDVVGFSSVAEKLSPERVFSELKEMLDEFTQCIHRHGGVVDKTLGDGVLCFFGIEEANLIHNEELLANHAERAVKCAAELQQISAQRSIDSGSKGNPVFPLRIGINTASVVIGDLGNAQRIDLTLIGHGVNIAKRMETAASSFLIMIGPSTRALIPDPEKLGVSIVRKWTAIKHQKDLIEAFEVNPFTENGKLLREAVASYRSYAGIEREGNRMVLLDQTVQVSTPTSGAGHLIDVSERGLGISLAKFLGRGVTLELSLSSKNRRLNQLISELKINPIYCEVKWGAELEPGQYFHGMEIQNRDAKKIHELIKVLQPSTRRPPTKRQAA